MNPKLKALLEKRAAAIKAADDILKLVETQKRDMTPEEITTVGKSQAEAQRLNGEIEIVRNQADLEKDEARDAFDANPPENRDENGRTVDFPDADKKNEFTRGLGEFLQSVHVAGATRSVTIDPRLTYWNNKQLAEARANGMNVSVPADGGFGVPIKYINELLGVKTETASQYLIDRCRRFADAGMGIEIPRIVETSRANGSRGGALKAYRKAEAASMTAATAKLGSLKLSASELFFLLPVTNLLLSNAPGLVSQVQGLVVPEMYHRVAFEVIQGSGAGECLGVTKAACHIEVTKEVGQKADTIVYENILEMEQRLDAESQMTAIWVINQFAPKQLRKLVTPVGTAGEVERIFKYNEFGPGLHGLDGRICIIHESCPKLGDVGDIILGDFSKYAMLFDPRVNNEASIHVYFVTNESAFRWVWNVNGEPEQAAAVTAEDTTTTVSPFVTIAAR